MNSHLSSNFLNNNSKFGSCFGQNQGMISSQAIFNPIMGNLFQNLLNEDYLSKEMTIPKKERRKNKIEENKKSKKFFTDYNSELKCSCNKTQCDKKYCECFNNNRFCVNCNCINCLNRPPKNSTCDVRPIQNFSVNNEKTKKLFCTCSKSGCKLKYCECYKNGLECTELCRCTKCENTKIPKEKNNFILKICYTNSIYVINNILKEDLKRTHFKKSFLNKKRKKPENCKDSSENENENETKNKEDENSGGRLFDKNGNMIFTHIKLNEIKKYQHSYNNFY